MPPQRSNSRKYTRYNKRKKIQGKLDVPRVERRRVRETVDYGEDEKDLAGKGLEKVAHGIEREHLRHVRSEPAMAARGHGTPNEVAGKRHH